MERRPHRTILIAASLALALSGAVPSRVNAAVAESNQVQGKDCSRDSMGLTPLNDLGAATYQSVQGGLYGGGSNQSPFGHAFDGLRVARTITPLDTAGVANATTGRVVLLALGGNVASQQFTVFAATVAADASRNPKLLVVNGAAGGYDLADAADPLSAYWDAVAASLRAAGSSPAQAQVAWMSFYVEASLGGFTASTDSTARLLTRAIRNARARLPNLKLLYLTPRIYAGYDNNAALTEPNGYWTGFAYRKVIVSQITGDSLCFDPARGAVVAPWIGWGPYLWADGMEPRSDGLTWECGDFVGNGYVPSQSGRRRVADSLMTFVKSDAATSVWYLPPITLDVEGNPQSIRSSASLIVAPNPARSATRLRMSGVEGAWSLRVMDLQGRIRRAFIGTGPAEVAWDLRDGDGIRVPAGLYWAQLRTNAGGISRAVIVR